MNIRLVALTFVCVFNIQPASSLAEPIPGDPITVATAANFKSTLEKLATLFESESSSRVTIISASSGVLFTQIKHGAPFDVFLSADTRRPLILANENQSSSFVYAIGQLVFWAPTRPLVDRQVFLDFTTLISIANPSIAPYGSAAMEVLNKLKPGYDKLVLGNSVNQTFQFVATGNASGGIISLSQLNLAARENFWRIPEELHTDIKQGGILLNIDNAEAQSFVDFLSSERARHIIARSGYRLPDLNLKEITIRD